MQTHRQPVPHGTLYQVVVYGNVVLYSICWMAQVPVLPYLVDKLGAAGSAQYGTLQTIFSAVQFIGGLISGPLMDHYGGRFLFAVSFAASMASYGLTATASSVWLLYLSRIPTILQHAVLAARAIVTQLSSEADRARVLGYVAVSYSVGFMVGPAVGGLLSTVSLQFAAWMATFGSALSLATVLLMLPDLSTTDSTQQHFRLQPGKKAQLGSEECTAVSYGHDKNTAVATATITTSGGGGRVGKQAGVAESGEPLKVEETVGGPSRPGGGMWHMLMQFVEVAKRPGVPDLLAGKLLVGLGSAVFQSMFPVLLKRRYGLDPRTNGMVMSYVGALLLGGQALMVGPVIVALGEPLTEHLCIAALVATYGTIAAAGTLWQLLLLLVPLSVAGMLYNNASTSRLTKATLQQQRGTALAIDMSLSSGVRMLSPALGAAVYDGFGHRAVPLLAAALIGSFLIALQLGWFRIPLPSKGANRGLAMATAPNSGEKGEIVHSSGVMAGGGIKPHEMRWASSADSEGGQVTGVIEKDLGIPGTVGTALADGIRRRSIGKEE